MARNRRRTGNKMVSTVGRERVPVDVSSYPGKLAVRVRQLREKSGLTVAELADEMGVAVSTVYAWESNARRIPARYYPKLAEFFELTAGRFFPPF